MEAPLLVYLDQADWQYVLDGSFPDASAQLLQWAKDGEISLVISGAHVIEIGGLNRGYQPRIDLVGNLPGVFVFAEYPDVLACRSARALTDAAFLREQPFHPPAVAPTTVAGLQEACDELRPAGAYVAQAASFDEQIRRLRGRSGKRALAEGANGAAAIARGDVEAVVRLLSKTGVHVGPLRRRFASALCSLGKAFAEHPGIAPFVPPIADGWDRDFSETVVHCLPEEIRASRAAKDQVFNLWRKGPHQAAWSALVVQAAVGRSQRESGEASTRSSWMDRWHSVYAPWCSLFTCDQRNAAPIAKALNGLAPTTIVKTRQLPQVVDALERIL